MLYMIQDRAPATAVGTATMITTATELDATGTDIIVTVSDFYLHVPLFVDRTHTHTTIDAHCLSLCLLPLFAFLRNVRNSTWCYCSITFLVFALSVHDVGLFAFVFIVTLVYDHI